MAVTEERRHRLYTKIEQLIGAEDASTMMELVPPVGWGDVATKRDLDQHMAITKRDLDEHLVATRRDLDQLGDRLRVEWAREMRSYFMATMAANTGLVAIAFVIARGT